MFSDLAHMCRITVKNQICMAIASGVNDFILFYFIIFYFVQY